MAQKPSIPKGTRDFSPEEMMRRNYIFDTIRAVFKKFGYQPIETPAMENIETLTGKYGDEGDQLLFKILNSRPYEAKDADKEKMRAAFDRTLQQNTNSKDLTEKALRYDLTVPFARYVVQHQNEISFPFKRYQIQPVWRADRPQKGRYREFFQCDADVIGSDSLINEVELVQMIDEAFTKFDVPVTIKINNRKILAGIAEVIGTPDKMIEIAIAIDKADKIGWDGVKNELISRGFTDQQFFNLHSLIISQAKSTIATEPLSVDQLTLVQIEFLKTDNRTKKSDLIQSGIKELQYVIETAQNLNLKTAQLQFDITLARGLNYYTGAIFEVKANKGTLTSSICGGGRYDDLTGIFGLPNLSGVGISFGIDRIFDVLNEVGYPEDVTQKEGTRVLFANFGGEDEKHSLQLLRKVREENIAAEIYPDAVKMGKQFKYADAKKIPFVAIIGENERSNGTIMLKNLQSGEQRPVNFEELLNAIR